MNWIVADMCGQVEVVRELVRDSHSFESERGVEAASEKFRVDACEGATRDVERMPARADHAPRFASERHVA